MTMLTYLRKLKFSNLNLVEILAISSVFLYPILFKIQIYNGIVIHPVELLFAVMWLIGIIYIRKKLRKSELPNHRLVRLLTIPILGFFLLFFTLEFSLIIMKLKGESPDIQDILIPFKYLLYLAPLPVFSYLSYKKGTKWVSMILILMAFSCLITILYSTFSMGSNLFKPVSMKDIYSFGLSTKMQGFLAQILIPGEGLVLRKDTVVHNSYANYLANIFIITFTMLLCPYLRSKMRVVIGLTAILSFLAIMFTGSRTGLLTALIGIFILPFLFKDKKPRIYFLITILFIFSIFWILKKPIVKYTPTGYKFAILFQKSTFDPSTSAFDPSTSTRTKTLFSSLKYLQKHSSVFITGIGYSRKKFSKKVIGKISPEIGSKVGHNLFLDILIKGGIFSLLSFLIILVGLLAPLVFTLLEFKVKNYKKLKKTESFSYYLVAGSLTIIFMNIFISFFQEQILTDITLFHIMTFTGIALGIWQNKFSQELIHQNFNIMYVFASKPAGGGGYKNVLELTEYAKEKNINTIIAMNSNSLYCPMVSSLGVRCIFLPLNNFRFSYIFPLLKTIAKNNITIIHSHGKGAGVYASILSCICGKITVFTQHGPHFSFQKGLRKFFDILVRIGITLFQDAVIFVSKGEKSLSIRYYIGRWNYRQVIFNGISEDNIKKVHHNEKVKARWELNLCSEDVVIGTIAWLTRVKGIDILLDAVSLLPQDIDSKFVIIGDGEEKNNLIKKAKHLGIEDKVIFTGFIENAPRLIPAFDVYIQPSRSEGMPIAVLEALARGVPVVATNVVGNADILKYGGGILVPLDNPKALANAIFKLLTDDQLREKLSKQAIEIVREHFTLNKCLSQVFQIYEHLLLSK